MRARSKTIVRDAQSQEKLSCRANLHCSKTVIHQLVQRPQQHHQIISGDSFGTISIWDVRDKSKCVHSFEASNNNDQSDCWALIVRFPMLNKICAILIVDMCRQLGHG